MDLYQKCEYAYKALLSDYKQKVMGKTPNPALSRETDHEFNPNNQKIISSQFPKVFAYALLKVDDTLFSSDSIYETVGSRSCRKLRDAITHGSSKKAINEVFDRKAVLFKVMNDFLKCFK